MSQKLSEILKLPYFCSLDKAQDCREEGSKDLSILSRYRIQSTDKFQSGFEKGALIVNLVDTPLGNISAVNVDLHGTSE